MPFWSLIDTRFCYPVSETVRDFIHDPTSKCKWSIKNPSPEFWNISEEFPNNRDTIRCTIDRFDYSVIHSMLDHMMYRMRDACEYIREGFSCIGDRSPGSLQWCFDAIFSIILRKYYSSEIFEGCSCRIQDIRDISCSGFCHSFYGDFFCDSINCSNGFL